MKKSMISVLKINSRYLQSPGLKSVAESSLSGIDVIKTEFTRGPGRGDTCHLSFLDETLPD